MPELVLHRPVADGVIATEDGLTITALALERLTLVQASPATRSWVPGALPGEPNRVSASASRRTLWLRPDAWLMVETVDATVENLPLDAVGLLDLSHAWTGFRLAGPHARDLLARGTPLDLRPSTFAEGQCARTWCAGFTILVEVMDDALVVRVDVALAQAFAAWLVDAAAGFRKDLG